MPVQRLDAICDELCVSKIHFLRVDTEGAENDVLGGIDLRRFRPWIVIVRAIKPHSDVPTHERWEYLLTGQQYAFVKFDGVNRYYVAAEREIQLRAALELPPNVYDQFISHSEWIARQQISLLKEEVEAGNNEVLQLQIYKSWRLTKPLRVFHDTILPQLYQRCLRLPGKWMIPIRIRQALMQKMIGDAPPPVTRQTGSAGGEKARDAYPISVQRTYSQLMAARVRARVDIGRERV